MEVVFGEDAARTRLDEAAQNFAVIRHIAVNLLKQHSVNLGIKRKRFRAALDDTFLLELLSQV